MVDKKYCVYCHTSPSGKRYIGITCQRPTHRWNNGEGYRYNKYFYHAIKKYGWENFSHEILYENLSCEDACSMEISLIAEYKSNDPHCGYNLSTGGEHSYSGCSWSEERRNLARRKMLGNKFCLGYKHSEETRSNMRQAQLNRKRVPLTEEQRLVCIANLPKTPKGGDNPVAKRVLCIETGVVYSCGREAAKDLGVQASHISNVCRGARRQTGGYHFRFYGEEEVLIP